MTMRGGKIVLLVSGLLLVLFGLGLAAAGVASGAVHLFQRDADGFVTTRAVDLASDSYALTAEHLELVVTPGDWAPWMERLDLRLRAAPSQGSGPVFVGIATRADAERYLAGVARDEVTNLGPPGPRYRTQPGEAVPGAPGDETFWAASTEGVGTQKLTWTAESGQWWVVIMNADASPGVAAEVDAGAQTGVLGPLALALLIAAVALLAGGTAMIVAAVPDTQRAPAPAAERPVPALPGVRTHPVALVGHLDPQVSRWQWLVKWLLLIPHVIVLVFLWAAFVVLTVVAWFAILFTGRYPRGIFEFNLGVLRWSWRVTFYGYSALGTDRYPPFTLDDVDYPARLDIAYPQRLSRGLVLVKSWLLALPHLLIVAVLTGGGASWTYQISAEESWQFSLGGGLIGLLVLVAGMALLFTARYPGGLFDLVVGLNRWVYRVIAYVALMTDDYPPFRLDLGGQEPGPDVTPPAPTPPTATPAPGPTPTPV
jgi:hypothetical protein